MLLRCAVASSSSGDFLRVQCFEFFWVFCWVFDGTAKLSAAAGFSFFGDFYHLLRAGDGVGWVRSLLSVICRGTDV